MPPIDWGRHLVGHPVPGRVDTKGRTRYHEANMAHPPAGATPDNTKEWERETWVARMASLSNFRHHVPGEIPTPDERQPAPCTYMTLMYNLHYTLSTTRRQTATQTRQHATTATRSQAQTQVQTRRHNGSASPAPRGRPL